MLWKPAEVGVSLPNDQAAWKSARSDGNMPVANVELNLAPNLASAPPDRFTSTSSLKELLATNSWNPIRVPSLEGARLTDNSPPKCVPWSVTST